MASWKALLARVDALSLKERALLLAALTLALLYLGGQWAVGPLRARERQVQQEIAEKEQAIASLKERIAQVEARGRVDPDAELRRQLAQVEGEIEAMRQAIRTEGPQLVPPEQMAEVLKTVLARKARLGFVALKGLGARPLQPPAEEGQAAEGQAAEGQAALAGAYLHGLELRLRGSYLELLAYLRELEALPWKFLWDSLSYEVREYPEGMARMVVYTLSLGPEWIAL